MLAPNSEKAPVPADRCINCRRALFTGDQAFIYGDGPIACVTCAPTWAHARGDWQREAFGDADGYRRFCKAYDAHIAAGGKPTDQCVSVL